MYYSSLEYKGYSNLYKCIRDFLHPKNVKSNFQYTIKTPRLGLNSGVVYFGVIIPFATRNLFHEWVLHIQSRSNYCLDFAPGLARIRRNFVEN